MGRPDAQVPLPAPAPDRDRDRHRGSVLVLFPAAVVVVLVLASVAVDFSIAFLGERELANATAAAANDAAAEAFADAAFYRQGAVELAGDEARRVGVERVRRALGDGRRYHGLDVDVQVVGSEVTVRASAEVDYLFARAIPGAPTRARVDARSTARAQESDERPSEGPG